MEIVLFDNKIRNYEDRIEHVNKKLKTESLPKKIKSQVDNEILAEDTNSGQMLEKVANYILGSKDIESGTKLKHRFYVSEERYQQIKKIGRVVVHDDTNIPQFEKYQVETSEDKLGYYKMLFDPQKLMLDDVRKFIKKGFINYDNDELFEDTSDDFREACKWLAKKIKKTSTNKDLDLLKEFDGKKTIVDIAKSKHVTHQNISKKITKISRNFLNKVAN